MKTLHLISLVVSCALLGACTRAVPMVLTVPVPTAQAGPQATPAPKEPFRIEIQKEWNDGGRLYVAGSVVVGPGFEAGDAVLRLRTFSQAEVKAETLQRLTVPAPSAEEASIGEGARSIPFVMTLPFSSLSDYQIDLLWGNDAGPYLSKLEDVQASPAVEIRSVRLRAASCENADCEQSHVVEAELFNAGNEAVTAMTIGVIFGGANSAETPEGLEELVEISGLRLLPGETQKLRLLIDEPLPETMRPLLQPQVRVVSYANQ